MYRPWSIVECLRCLLLPACSRVPRMSAFPRKERTIVHWVPAVWSGKPQADAVCAPFSVHARTCYRHPITRAWETKLLRKIPSAWTPGNIRGAVVNPHCVECTSNLTTVMDLVVEQLNHHNPTRKRWWVIDTGASHYDFLSQPCLRPVAAACCLHFVLGETGRFQRLPIRPSHPAKSPGRVGCVQAWFRSGRSKSID